MNRNEEYMQFMQELEENTPDLQVSVCKARKRRARKQLIYRPLVGIAAVFVLFVLSVNFCAPVAYACSRIPLLKELAEAVTFSRSLTDAVENEYVQPMNLTQTKNGITVEVTHLIVDRKQVNVFYRITSEQYEWLDTLCNVRTAEGAEMTGYTVANSSGNDITEEKLQCITIDFVELDVPDAMCINLRVYDGEFYGHVEDCVEEFSFLLEFDPEFTETGKVYEVNQTVTLDGQIFSVTQVEVYPTHLQIKLTEDGNNTAWLRDLEFYIETNKGEKFYSPTNGISASGAKDSESMLTYRADSTYFYEAKKLTLVITGAKWLEKGKEKVWVDLEKRVAENLPEEMTLEKIMDFGSGKWYLNFVVGYEHREEGVQRSLFYWGDNNKEEDSYHSFGTWELDDNVFTGEDGKQYFRQQIRLLDYPDSEIWLYTDYTNRWTADKEITVNIQ